MRAKQLGGRPAAEQATRELMPQKMLAKLDKAAAQFDPEGQGDSQRPWEAYAVHTGSKPL